MHSLFVLYCDHLELSVRFPPKNKINGIFSLFHARWMKLGTIKINSTPRHFHCSQWNSRFNHKKRENSQVNVYTNALHCIRSPFDLSDSVSSIQVALFIDITLLRWIMLLNLHWSDELLPQLSRRRQTIPTRRASLLQPFGCCLHIFDYSSYVRSFFFLSYWTQ